MADSAKTLQVVIGILINAEKKVLIAKRPEGVPLAGKWEFPGGKVENNETYEQAICRELYEELDIKVTSLTAIPKVSYAYADRIIALTPWIIKEYHGNAHGKEGQLIRWVFKSDLPNYSFPAANQAIIEQLVSFEM